MAACSVVFPASNLCMHRRLYKSRRGTYRPPRAGLSNESQSPSSVIKQVYSSINDRNLKRLSSFIADDCFFEDTTFSKPFEGKKIA
ncbi:hypothetical protein QJS10_CPA01g02378 [Acorus calamus]|uniref:Nuclear transport factor 2 domain-containing protein n=1 Tax=Acorus calamus TaxID=4465 RepID=A0AAV9FLJ6_ACOCL|nr:hypothetical protein QJS10_CPA01g02378 [Acorus calamus]